MKRKSIKEKDYLWEGCTSSPELFSPSKNKCGKQGGPNGPGERVGGLVGI